jgi:hypothetical protein
MNLLEFSQHKRTGESMLIYGPPKVGKTELAASLAKQFNLLWFDLENGLQTVVRTPRLTDADRARIQVVSIPDTKANPVAIDTMLKVLTGMPGEICQEHGKWGCLACKAAKPPAPTTSVELRKLDRSSVVVIDSGTQLSDSAWASVVGPNLDAQTEWKHYDKWNQRIAMCLSFIQQAPYHTVLLAHGLSIELQDGTERIVPKMGTKAFSENVAKYFSHVLYAETKFGKYSAGSTPDYNVKVLLGNRAGIKFETDKTKLTEFFT